MKYLLPILCLFISSCSSLIIDYRGNELDLNDEHFIIMDMQRDPINNDVFHITGRFSNESYRNHHLGTIGFKKRMGEIANEYNYWGYHTISSSNNYTTSLELWTKYFYEIRFHKTEEDFDKWNVRLKD